VLPIEINNMIQEYVKQNWESLPKSTFDDIQVVIVKEVRNSEEGWGHHYYEGYGIDEGGGFRWLFSSGCSCNGGPSENDTIKDFMIGGEDMKELNSDDIDFKALEVHFSTY